MIGTNPSPEKLAIALQEWIEERRDAHARFRELPLDFGERVELLRELQRELFDAGWMRYGWPEAHGGLGGTAQHRAVVVDYLLRNGYPPRHIFEHLDILAPTLVHFGHPATVERLFLPTLRGDILWAQGFSEPTAGSDLAALRTRAEAVEGGYRIEGHKIWTSWAKWADQCLFLARTGTPEEHHRGLSAFVIDLSAPGLQVGPIRQANGTDELAEVFFDGAIVPTENRIGEEGQGWAVAMFILAGERGAFPWLRSCENLPKLERLARAPRAAEHTGALGESLSRILGLRCRARAVVEILARGEAPGPESSVTKVLTSDTEQHLYDVVREIHSPGIDLGTCEDAERLQEAYLYSRAASIYGGARQIQLNVIARLMVSRGGSARGEGDDEEGTVVRESVAEALEKSKDAREALDGLDWWAYAASPDDELGRTAFAAWFEGQGRALAASSALAAVRCAPAAVALRESVAEFAYAFEVPGAAGGSSLLACGLDDRTRWIAIEDADRGLRVLPAKDVEISDSGALDTALVRKLQSGATAGEVVRIDADAQQRAFSLARTAAAYEILGASQALLDLSVTHTNEREQFGQPLSQFQSLQHLLSESQIDVAALAELCDAALEQVCAGGGSELATAAKAYAGRIGRAVAQRALQCFGGIGFTWEHPHHLYSRRIHTLDAILGSHYALHRELGAELVRTGQAPRAIDAWRPE
jgi:alkylation response protein AidB-like acyl-CoA dehydrogenase